MVFEGNAWGELEDAKSGSRRFQSRFSKVVDLGGKQITSTNHLMQVVTLKGCQDMNCYLGLLLVYRA